MARILIYDVAAESGGAVSVLLNYYRIYDRTEDDVIFVVSKVQLEENHHLHVIKLPWVKKSWLHRLFCDMVYMPHLARKLKVEEVVSLQNIAIPFMKVPQTVYVHNAIPFSEYHFTFRESKFLWLYQNMIGRITKRSLRRADYLIVQNDWMKKAIVHDCGISVDKIDVERLKIPQPENMKREELAYRRYFFPSGESTYKNHKCIIKACHILHQNGINNYEVVFTLDPHSETAKETHCLFKGDDTPLKFVGYLSQKEMEKYYLSSTLIFPSYLETVGLPLLEAIAYSAPIIAADCEYAHDSVNGYKDVKWFDPHSFIELAKIMRKEIEQNS